MSYRLKKNEPATEGLARIVREQIDRGLHELADTDIPRANAIHQVRKRCKKIRAALRLAKPLLDDYPEHNDLFRDLARSLSAARDNTVMFDTLNALTENQTDPTDLEAVDKVRQCLAASSGVISGDKVEVDRKIAATIETLEGILPRYKSLGHRKHARQVIAEEVHKTVRRGRAAMAAAYKNPSAESFHEWRKRIKRGWYHTRLLQDAWPREMKARRKVLKSLAEVLGDEHDLAVLADRLTHEPERYGGPARVRAVLGLIDQQHTVRRSQARRLARKAFTTKQNKLIKHVKKYIRK